MLYLPSLISSVEVLIVTVPVLLTVAFVTVAERKTMASMQRRLGPNIVEYYGLLQELCSPPKPHAFVSLPVQSFYFRFNNQISIFLLSVFCTLSLKWLFKDIAIKGDMLVFYPFINMLISLGLAYFISALSSKGLSKGRIAFIIVMSGLLPLIVIIITNNMGNLYI